VSSTVIAVSSAVIAISLAILAFCSILYIIFGLFLFFKISRFFGRFDRIANSIEKKAEATVGFIDSFFIAGVSKFVSTILEVIKKPSSKKKKI
jgi:hypothetical protein